MEPKQIFTSSPSATGTTKSSLASEYENLLNRYGLSHSDIEQPAESLYEYFPEYMRGVIAHVQPDASFILGALSEIGSIALKPYKSLIDYLSKNIEQTIRKRPEYSLDTDILVAEFPLEKLDKKYILSAVNARTVSGGVMILLDPDLITLFLQFAIILALWKPYLESTSDSKSSAQQDLGVWTRDNLIQTLANLMLVSCGLQQEKNVFEIIDRYPLERDFDEIFRKIYPSHLLFTACLLFVLAHEYAHVICKHQYKEVDEKKEKFSLVADFRFQDMGSEFEADRVASELISGYLNDQFKNLPSWKISSDVWYLCLGPVLCLSLFDILETTLEARTWVMNKTHDSTKALLLAKHLPEKGRKRLQEDVWKGLYSLSPNKLQDTISLLDSISTDVSTVIIQKLGGEIDNWSARLVGRKFGRQLAPMFDANTSKRFVDAVTKLYEEGGSLDDIRSDELEDALEKLSKVDAVEGTEKEEAIKELHKQTMRWIRRLES